VLVSSEATRKKGVPISAPMNDPLLVHDTLTGLSVLYPGQLFFLEDGPDFNSVVISWVPPWYVNSFVNGIMTARLMESERGPLAWPNK